VDDVDAYVRMRCELVMMAEVRGPLPREGIEGRYADEASACLVGELDTWTGCYAATTGRAHRPAHRTRS
jgi:hypothetical protein